MINTLRISFKGSEQFVHFTSRAAGAIRACLEQRQLLAIFAHNLFQIGIQKFLPNYTCF